MSMFRTALLIAWGVLSLVPGSTVQAASPLEEALSAIKAFFSAGEPPAEAAPQARPSEAEIAYQDALRLRDRGADAEAVRRLTDAANAGHAGAAYELGMLYTQGRRVEEDLQQAAQWINRAADLGDARAQYLVGANFMSGTGGTRDPTRGVGFLARAGEQGHARAQYLLGQAYVDGIGVAANPAWAARWYGRAARAGHPDAQFAYGVMYGSGLGLPHNARDAYWWLVLAANNGQPRAADVARQVAARLSPVTAAEVRAEAVSFVPRVQAKLSDVPTVLFVQYALQLTGYDPGPVDGLMGSRTRAGIRAFQADAGVPRTGQISASILEQLIGRTASAG